MRELRAPDPTLDAHTAAVLVADGGPGRSVAHRWNLGDHSPACGAEAVKMLRSWDAAYIAVPCRACFPDAPPPGQRRLYEPGTSVTQAWVHDDGLSWQVPSTGLYITERDDVGCPLHDASHDPSECGDDREDGQ